MPKPYRKEFRDDVVRVARNREPEQHLKQIAADFGISRCGRRAPGSVHRRAGRQDCALACLRSGSATEPLLAPGDAAARRIGCNP